MKAISRIVYLPLLFLLPMMVPAARAQDKGEISVFGGYSHSWNISANQGWNASIAGNVAKHLAFVADFSESNGSVKYSSPNFRSEDNYRNFGFLFGPRYVNTVRKRWTPFAHALFGLERLRTEGQGTSGLTAFSYGPFAENAFAAAFGGGIDIRLNNRVSVRALQFDGVGIDNNGYWGYYLRASFGAVFRLSGGSK
jgi:hypothetical protein